MITLRHITEQKHLSAADKTFILHAHAVAKRAHTGRKRASGEEYITHPLAVAETVAGLGFDARTIAAALLHDVLEDTPLTKEEMTEQFGSEVAFLVDGVTKLKAIKYRGTGPRKRRDPQIESLKKMFLAMADDIRVMLIKLADRLHNMQTLEYKDPAKRTRKARETLEIYAPIADRLGMGRLRGELEDLSFPYAYPDEYSWLKRNVKGKFEQRLRYIERTAPVVKMTLTKAGIPVSDIHARAKRKWSLFKKLQRYDMDPDKVMDLVALRIIVPEVKDCYEALGVIHAAYKPLPGRVKDYIAVAKPNGYQSLHTTVFCEKGRIAEIQIRTRAMHEHAENGIAAHWLYKEHPKGSKAALAAAEQEVAWMERLRTYFRNLRTSSDLGGLKTDFLHDRIYVFTPNGDVKDLPAGATPIDFAYAIHSDIGHSITSAQVNDRIVPLNYALRSGDVVKVVKRKNNKPSWDWLKFVQTTEARRHIRSWFKRHDPTIAIADGKKAVNKELTRVETSLEKLSREQVNSLLAVYSEKKMDDLLTTVSMGGIDPSDIVRKLFPDAYRAPRTRRRKRSVQTDIPVARLTIGGQVGLEHRIGKCCSPAIGQAVVGYITRAKGVTVHATECANIKNADSERLLEAIWS